MEWEGEERYSFERLDQNGGVQAYLVGKNGGYRGRREIEGIDACCIYICETGIQTLECWFF